MIKITFEYNGKKYSDLEQAFRKMTADGLREIVENKVKPFENEIQECGGTVTINIPEDMSTGSVSFEAIPDDLKERIEAAFRN